jgi:predicted DsbA family dithiol-disulfide isomerase
VVERLKEEYNVEVEWRPFYLRPDTPPEGMGLPDYIKQARTNGSEERLKQIADSYGMAFVSTERIYNTRLAHEATEFARENEKGNEFHKIIFRKVYVEGEDPSNWKALRSAAVEAGLDADAMQRDVEAGKYTEFVAGQVQNAYQIGVQGVPTYVINDRYAVVGAQPYEVFVRAVEKLKGSGEI